MSGWKIEWFKLVPRDCLHGSYMQMPFPPLATLFSVIPNNPHQAFVSHKTSNAYIYAKPTPNIPVYSADQAIFKCVCLDCSWLVPLQDAAATFLLMHHVTVSAVCCLLSAVFKLERYTSMPEITLKIFRMPALLSSVIVYCADLFLLMLCSHLVVLLYVPNVLYKSLWWLFEIPSSPQILTMIIMPYW